MRIILFPAIIIALLLTPALFLAYNAIGPRIIFNLFAADSMYYMAVANNFLKFGVHTFDGIGPTNGFQPLWQWALVTLFSLSNIGHHFQIYVVFAACATLVYAAYTMLSITFLYILGLWTGLLATLLLFPGVYALFFEPRRHEFGEPGMLYSLNPISAINGMETPLSLALWALFFLVLVQRFVWLRQRPHQHVTLITFFPPLGNLCLALLVLTRLDDVIMIGALVLFILSQRGYGIKEKCSTIFLIIWPSIVLIAAYAFYNLHTLGIILPVSAAKKLGFAWHENAALVIESVIGQRPDLWFIAVRVFPLIFAYCAGSAALSFGQKRRHLKNALASGSFGFLLVPCGYYLVVKAAFLMVCVPFGLQGYWYYFVMVTMANAMVAVVIGYYCRRYSQRRRAFVICLAVVLSRISTDAYFMDISPNQEASFNFDYHAPMPYYNLSYADVAYVLWSNEDKIRASLSAQAPGLKLIDTFDGMYGYLLDQPAQSFTGLASSPAQIESRETLGIWRAMIGEDTVLMPNYGYLDPKRHPDDLHIVDRLQIPSLPIAFYRVKLVAKKMP